MILKTSKTIPDRLDPAPPAIGSNGNWWAYDSATGKYTDTGVKAQGKDGKDGKDGHSLSLSITMTAPPVDDCGNGAVGMFKAKVLYDGAEVTDKNLIIYSRDTGKDGTLSDWDDGETMARGELDFIDSVFTADYFYLESKVTYKGLTAYDSITYHISKEGLLRKDLSDATKTIDTLRAITTAIQNGELDPNNLADIQYLLNAIQNTPGGSLGGLTLTNVIALSDVASSLVTAYLSGISKNKDGKALAMLKAGVKDFGKSSESEAVAIYHDGTAHFGQQYLNGDRLDYKEGTSADPYMSIGKGVISQTIEQVLAANALDTTSTIPNYYKTGSPTAPDSGTKDVGSFFVQNDNSVVTITGTLVVDLRGASATVNYQLAQAELRLDSNAEIASVYAKRQASVADDTNSVAKINASLRLGRGLHVLSVEHLFMPFGGVVSLQDVQIRQQYSTNLKQALFAASGFRLLDAALKRYFDIDFSRSSSDSFIKIGGGVKVDYVDMPGTPLCGAIFDESGTEVKAFGRYKNKSGTSYAYAYYDYSSKSYTVYHSIGHSKYIPMVTVTATKSARMLCVSDISAYSFRVTSYFPDYDQSKIGFSYIAFKSD